MAVSTEATVNAAIVAAIRDIYADLGFDEPQGNVRAYPLEMHDAAQAATYLRASVDGKNVARCWAVDVRGHYEPFALGRIPQCTYAIRITGYYAKGQDGEGYTALLAGARKISGALNTLGPTLSGTVTRILSATPIEPTERDSESGKLITGFLGIQALRTNPDF